ncbi:alpha/beta-hydrolase [Lojkania enalia]|uniref:Alpha/beta-hydrolase n=1 Tax=Lojkania enalia TaxID=147567 RepID=A0A9P4JXE4_9PLEO|nr:alpha/beta-hydrolase [Didymosphaeria enalia]
MMNWLWRLFVATILFAVSDATPSSIACSSAPTVTIDSGEVVGTTTKLAGATITVDQYLGIPFAVSPTRFAPPVKPTPWKSPYQATKYGPACIQQFNYLEASRNTLIAWFNTPLPPAGENEDCLNLNVYVPATPGKIKTVMTWIYDIIIVTPNYRANVFGFPNSPELPLAKRNVGFWDQRIAGAASIDNLVLTHPKDPPFRAAIMESGQSSLYVNPTNAPTSWLALTAALNCTQTHPHSNLTCLRSVNASIIKSTAEHLTLPFRPVADNVTMHRYPEKARLNRDIAPVPILTGMNANEATIITLGQSNATAFLAPVLGNDTALIQEIVDTYTITPPARELAAILTDLLFTCPASIVANDSHASGFPTWQYYFNTSFPNTQLFPGAEVYHYSEIPIVWGTYPRENATAYEKALSRYMQSAWATFARNPTGGPGWEALHRIASLGSGGILNTPIDSDMIGRNCFLFGPYYKELGFFA